jgi:hypothetical protein
MPALTNMASLPQPFEAACGLERGDMPCVDTMYVCSTARPLCRVDLPNASCSQENAALLGYANLASPRVL